MVDFDLDVWEDNSPEGVIHSYIFEISIGECSLKFRLDDIEFETLKKTINEDYSDDKLITLDKCVNCFAQQLDDESKKMCIASICIKENDYDPETRIWTKK